MSVQLTGEGGKGVEERTRKGRRMERKGEGGLGRGERCANMPLKSDEQRRTNLLRSLLNPDPVCRGSLGGVLIRKNC